MPKSDADKRQKESIAYTPTGDYSKNSDSYQGAANQMPAQKQEATGLSKAKMSAKKDRAVTAAAPSKEKINDAVGNTKDAQLNKAVEDLSVGIFQYENKKYSEAITTFNGILSVVSKGNIFENAQWYLANSYNVSGDKAAAKSLFQQIVRGKGTFAKKAAKMLE
jgi:TolA-binding protein